MKKGIQSQRKKIKIEGQAEMKYETDKNQKWAKKETDEPLVTQLSEAYKLGDNENN